MQSQLTVRLPDNIQKNVSSLAKKLHLKRSDIVRMALEQFIQGVMTDNNNSPYEQVKHLLGSVSSGISDLGGAHRKHLLKKIRKDA